MVYYVRYVDSSEARAKLDLLSFFSVYNGGISGAMRARSNISNVERSEKSKR